MSGVPAVYYHGTGSENASRVYTETPMQHVQRTALRKKCMKSTFTLDCGKKERIRLLPYFCLSVRLSLRFRSYLYISSFNSLSLSLSLSPSIHPSVFTSLCKHIYFSFRQSPLLLFHILAKHRSLSLQFIGVTKRFADGFAISFAKRFWREGQSWSVFCSASLIAIHTFLRSSIPANEK